MPLGASLSDELTTFSLVPFGVGGLDEFTHESLLSPEYLRQADNVRLSKLSLDRRQGALKLTAFSDPTGSKTFGADTRYATISAGSQLEDTSGGFALGMHFTAVRPSAGNTGYILSSRVNGQSYHVLSVSIDENGLVTVGFEKQSGGTASVTTSATTSGGDVSLLALLDIFAGTFTVYVNGASSGTPVTGLSASDAPIAGSGTDWHFGAHYNPATAGVVANTHFDGKLQGVTLHSLRGLRPASGTTTVVETLLKHSSRVWPAPQLPQVLFHYDMHGSSLTSLTDASRFKNHAAVTGTITSTASVALPSIPTNAVQFVTTPSGRRDNVVCSHGRLFYETLAAATA